MFMKLCLSSTQVIGWPRARDGPIRSKSYPLMLSPITKETWFCMSMKPLLQRVVSPIHTWTIENQGQPGKTGSWPATIQIHVGLISWAGAENHQLNFNSNFYGHVHIPTQNYTGTRSESSSWAVTKNHQLPYRNIACTNLSYASRTSLESQRGRESGTLNSAPDGRCGSSHRSQHHVWNVPKFWLTDLWLVCKVGWIFSLWNR